MQGAGHHLQWYLHLKGVSNVSLPGPKVKAGSFPLTTENADEPVGESDLSARAVAKADAGADAGAADDAGADVVL